MVVSIEDLENSLKEQGLLDTETQEYFDNWRDGEAKIDACDSMEELIAVGKELRLFTKK